MRGSDTTKTTMTTTQTRLHKTALLERPKNNSTCGLGADTRNNAFEWAEFVMICTHLPMRFGLLVWNQAWPTCTYDRELRSTSKWHDKWFFLKSLWNSLAWMTASSKRIGKVRNIVLTVTRRRWSSRTSHLERAKQKRSSQQNSRRALHNRGSA